MYKASKIEKLAGITLATAIGLYCLGFNNSFRFNPIKSMANSIAVAASYTAFTERKHREKYYMSFEK